MDTRVLLHANNTAKCGFKEVVIATVDTDVVIIALSMYPLMKLDELWIASGVGKHLRYIPIHHLSKKFELAKSRSITIFHALTGCDQVTFFSGYGKKTAFKH